MKIMFHFNLIRVVPIFKKGQLNAPTNQSPIAIISYFEIVLKTQIVDYLRMNNLLHNHQYGF